MLAKRTKVILFTAYILAIGLIFIASAEGILRLKGLTPWRVSEVKVAVSPGNQFFMKHPELGYTHIPGLFEVTLRDSYTFNVTHLPDTLRITQPLDNYKDLPQREEIWIFGCSLTHGWSLNDEETYPWLLQEQFPGYEVRNFGVSGYGTLHSLIQFREAIVTGRPKLAILAYADFHDQRNTFLRSRRKQVAPWNKLGPLEQPFARLDENDELVYSMAEVTYREFPLMRRLVFAHFIETNYNQLEDRLVNSHGVSEALVREMDNLASKHNVEFVVAGVDRTEGTKDMLKFAGENGIPNVDISVDLELPGYRNLPHDVHPSAIANRKYAEKLGIFIKSEMHL